MVPKSRKLGWLASGILAAALFAAASPAQAQIVHRGFAPRVRVRYSRFYRPYYVGRPYYYYAASPYYYPYYPYYYSGYYARPYYYGGPYVSFSVGPRIGFRGHFRGRW